jgi:hypothetical protein
MSTRKKQLTGQPSRGPMLPPIPPPYRKPKTLPPLPSTESLARKKEIDDIIRLDSKSNSSVNLGPAAQRTRDSRNKAKAKDTDLKTFTKIFVFVLFIYLAIYGSFMLVGNQKTNKQYMSAGVALASGFVMMGIAISPHSNKISPGQSDWDSTVSFLYAAALLSISLPEVLTKNYFWADQFSA